MKKEKKRISGERTLYTNRTKLMCLLMSNPFRGKNSEVKKKINTI